MKFDFGDKEFKIIFADEEIEILNKTKCLTFDMLESKHISNVLGKVSAEMALKLGEKYNGVHTFEDDPPLTSKEHKEQTLKK